MTTLYTLVPFNFVQNGRSQVHYNNTGCSANMTQYKRFTLVAQKSVIKELRKIHPQFVKWRLVEMMPAISKIKATTKQVDHNLLMLNSAASFSPLTFYFNSYCSLYIICGTRNLWASDVWQHLEKLGISIGLQSSHQYLQERQWLFWKL
jgi:hypothetical protein